MDREAALLLASRMVPTEISRWACRFSATVSGSSSGPGSSRVPAWNQRRSRLVGAGGTLWPGRAALVLGPVARGSASDGDVADDLVVVRRDLPAALKLVAGCRRVRL